MVADTMVLQGFVFYSVYLPLQALAKLKASLAILVAAAFRIISINSFCVANIRAPAGQACTHAGSSRSLQRSHFTANLTSAWRPMTP
jgi:hypothetical protein